MQPGVTRTHVDPTSSERLQPIRRELGITTFGFNLLALEPGQRGRIHRHTGQEEAYLVLEGALRRQLVNRGTTRVLLIALGGSAEHVGRDAEAFASWDDTSARLPAELPIPADIPVPRDVPVPPDLRT
jgi:hypothetical protein